MVCSACCIGLAALGVVTSIDEIVGGVHGEAILAAMPVRRAARAALLFGGPRSHRASSSSSSSSEGAATSEDESDEV